MPQLEKTYKNIDPEAALQARHGAMERDRIAHDKRAKELPPLLKDQKVLIWDEIKECWNKKGIVAEVIASSEGRSYKILSQGSFYTRNRRHLRPDIPSTQQLLVEGEEAAHSGALDTPRTSVANTSLRRSKRIAESR